jgi:hypothetical protein
MKQQLAGALSENEALRTELAAFDPEFWDEIEDLKYERQQLAEKVAEYERLIENVPAQVRGAGRA